MAIGPELPDRRLPGFQKGSTKTEQVIRVFPVVASVIVPALHQIVGQGWAIGPHVADGHAVGRPIGLAESGDEIGHRASLAIVHEDTGVGLSLVTKLSQPTDD